MRIVNEATGEVMELQGGRWVPVDQKPAAAPAVPRGRITTGTVNAILASAGDELTNWGRNVRDVYAGATGDKQTQLDIIDERDEAAQLRQMLHQEAPYAAAFGAALPGLATLPIGGGIGAGKLGALGADVATGAGGRLATNVVSSAALGGLGSTSGQIGADALAGGGFAGGGSLASNMVSRVSAGRRAMAASRAQQAAGQAVSTLDDAERGVIEGARRAGMRVTPGQELGDNTLRQIEASASSSPILSPYWQKLRQENARQVNTLAARAMGVEADNVGAAVLAQAEHQIGQEFDDIGRRIGTVDAGPIKKALTEAADDEAVQLLPRTELQGILKELERGIVARAGAAADQGADLVTGQSLMRARSTASTRMRDAYSAGKSELGQIYGEVLETFDKAIRTSAARTAGDAKAGPALARAYDQARDRWTVLRAMERGGATIDGQVSTGKAAQIIGSSDKTRYAGRADDAGQTLRRGGTGNLGEDATGDFYDALRFSTSRIGKDIVGDSGTATRMSWGQMLTGGPVEVLGKVGGAMLRRAAAGPLAEHYMRASPEAAQAWQAALQQSALQGWARGQAAGGIAARGVQSLGQGLLQP